MDPQHLRPGLRVQVTAPQAQQLEEARVVGAHGVVLDPPLSRTHGFARVALDERPPGSDKLWLLHPESLEVEGFCPFDVEADEPPDGYPCDGPGPQPRPFAHCPAPARAHKLSVDDALAHLRAANRASVKPCPEAGFNAVLRALAEPLMQAGLVDDVAPDAVSRGCAARAAFIQEQVTTLAQQWADGNRDHVFAALLQLPQGVALAVTAGVAVALGTDAHKLASGLLERA